MNAFEFLSFFRDYYDLRFTILYCDGNELVNKYTSRTVGVVPRGTTESQAAAICKIVKEKIEAEIGLSIDTFKKNPSVQDYYNYLNFVFSRRMTRNGIVNGGTTLRIEDFDEEAPTYVDQEVHEQAMIMYLKKHTNLTDNEIQVRIFKRPNTFTGPYADICNELKMTCTGTKYDLSCIAFRPKMAFSSKFKYGDKFKTNVSLESLMTYKFNEQFNRAWVCTEDDNLLLISMKQYHFLTTRDALAKDLGMSLELFNHILSEHITKSKIEAFLKENAESKT